MQEGSSCGCGWGLKKLDFECGGALVEVYKDGVVGDGGGVVHNEAGVEDEVGGAQKFPLEVFEVFKKDARMVKCLWMEVWLSEKVLELC